MNTYAVMVQTGTMSATAQWLVIGLSVASLLLALVVSGTTEIPTWKVRVVGAVAVALVMAVLASTASAAIFLPCTDPAGIEWYWWLIWGC